MKRYIFLIVGFSLLVSRNIYAQGEQNIWTFGQYYSLDFNTTPPTLLDRSNNPNYRLPAGVSNDQSIVVCDAQGNRLFTVRKSIDLQSNVPDIYDRFDNPIPGTALLTNSGAGLNSRTEQIPSVVPHPGNPNQYYLFYGRNGGLLYSLFDISLNNGLGNIVLGQHNIVVSGYNSVSGKAMTTLKGCDGIWLVIKEQLSTGFLSYKIDHNGLNNIPVKSSVNLIRQEYFDLIRNIKPSPNDNILAVTFPSTYNIPLDYHVPGGFLLFDFEKCSGKLINERILDWDQSFEGICFSPDNSKLYVTQNDTGYVQGLYTVYRYGKVFQYDLSLPTWNDIQNSKTLILTNPEAYLNTIGCPLVYCRLGDMKLCPDGKIYLLNNHPGVCFGTALAFHIINQPNNSGMTCLPQVNALYNVLNGMGAIASHDPTPIELPRDIVFAPKAAPDTVLGNIFRTDHCFEDSILLIAKYGEACYQWNTGSTDTSIWTSRAGTYWLSYYVDCKIITDTYHVSFTPLPQIKTQQYGCPEDMTIEIENSYNYDYKLYADNGTLVGNWKGDAIRINGMDAGIYKLEITTPNGCDTLLELNLIAYPSPAISVSPIDPTIKYGDQIRLNASGGMMYTWWPVEGLDTARSANPIARPKESMDYIVTGWNEYGCTDTAHTHVTIDYTMPDMIPNAFTPNGDGLNDIFRIEGITNQHIRSFEVYNRYGERVHFEHYSNNGWDGTYRGKPCDVGTYFYLIEIDNPRGISRLLKGDVLLLR